MLHYLNDEQVAVNRLVSPEELKAMVIVWPTPGVKVPNCVVVGHQGQTLLELC